tara:strand:+ start:468 stop:893 length:426 start_codon:yes stop_codon:yes gene_type:complete
MNIFSWDDNEWNRLDGFHIGDSDQVDRFVNALRNCGDSVRVWLSQDQMDRDSDTWRGINRCFDVSRTQISMLRRRGIVTDSFFDDGTLHITINTSSACSAILDAMPCDDVQSIITNLQNDIDDANRIIDGLQNTNSSCHIR